MKLREYLLKRLNYHGAEKETNAKDSHTDMPAIEKAFHTGAVFALTELSKAVASGEIEDLVEDE